MNNTNPLIPQGSLLEQTNKGRAKVKIYVFCVLGFHICVLGALLLIGCKRDTSTDTASQTADTNAAPTNIDTSTLPVPPAAPSSNTVVQPTLPPVTNVAVPPTPTSPPPTVPSGTTTEYVVTKGDSFYTIGKKFGVSMKAIQDANPDASPTKLKLGQKLQIPAPKSASGGIGPSGGTSAISTDTGSGENTYTVASGDSLTKIATKHGVSLKALRNVNDLKTDKIKVGQKLKIPAKASAPVDNTPVAAPAATSSVPPLSAPGAGR
jgi:LysM repeat protein